MTTSLRRPPTLHTKGWLTTDDDERERRRLRGLSESMAIRSLEAEHPLFGTFRVCSEGGGAYTVELRSIEVPLNSCSCPDFTVNGLGTCKHIEGVLHHLETKFKKRWGKLTAKGSGRVEIMERDDRVVVLWPERELDVRRSLDPYFGANGTLLGSSEESIGAIRRMLATLPPEVRNEVRISALLEEWVSKRRERERRKAAREQFLCDVKSGKRSLDLVDAKLYPYQEEGVLHLAFTGRAMLADEMGLGKTIQAIAAAELMRRTKGIERVLIIAPASLKAEWEEQIRQFTNLPTCLVIGPKSQRTAQYRKNAFFFLTNYEQIRCDGEEIQQLLAPDLIILDEAQRIKNWQTKTAQAVKRLQSDHVFVLTGTPLENRIDEIYSLMQVIDPSLFGPLFRFNRDFYKLDEKGQPVGYKNLGELHKRLRPVFLRRLKSEVEEQLPSRTVNHYFVKMTAEQRGRYEEHSTKAARLLQAAKSRSLRPEERDTLQRSLACMRMICDTPYILDETCKVSPKIDELRELLPEVLSDPESKVIIFSEWERMLLLVKELADELGVECAWHTGTVPQQKRREEINKFKRDPRCRLFLSTDAGATGLNLQAANTVINCDLPWNPAKLEQRIGRAWRKNQTRPVQVINLVCEESIEQRMVGTLSRKQQLADGVLDGKGNLCELELTSGVQSLSERLGVLMEGTEQAKSDKKIPAHEAFTGRLSERLLLLERREGGLLAVVDKIDPATQQLADELDEEVELLDKVTYASIRRLIALGFLQFSDEGTEMLFSSSSLKKPESKEAKRRKREADKFLAKAERKRDMARVLRDSGFEEEAKAPEGEAKAFTEEADRLLL